jgi:hypothetical protein
MRLVMSFLRFLEPVPEEYSGAEDKQGQNRVTDELIELAEGCSHANNNHGNDEQKFDEKLNGRGKPIMHRAPPCVV